MLSHHWQDWVVVRVQPRLIRLLGQSVFDEYAGKIYQLKFYEETAFGGAVNNCY